MTRDDLEADVRAAWDFDDLPASARRFEQRATSTSDTDEQAVWETQVARTYGLADRFDAANDLLDTIAATALGAHARARLAIERGRVLNSSGDPTAAEPLFASAHDLARTAGRDGLAVDALHMKAIALGATGDIEGSATAALAALELAESSPDPTATAWLPALLNNLGWTRHDDGDYTGALALFERAVEHRLADDSSAAQIVVAEWAVARTLRSLGRLEDALAIQQRLATQPAGTDDPYVAEEIAACLAALGRS
jgi:tetratricopeptide (TPR) repeat protein